MHCNRMNMSVACSFLLPFHLHMRSFSFSVSLYSDDFLTVIGFQWFFFWENHFLLHFHWECRHSVIVITEHWIKCAYLVKLKHSFPLSNDNECDWLPNIKPYHLKRMATLGKFHWFLMNWRFFLLLLLRFSFSPALTLPAKPRPRTELSL